jgi:peroxiredoxin
MTQPPTDILFRIERLLNANRQQEARRLLLDYVKINPDSARAWWLMSLTVTDIDQQVDCLQRVLGLDPGNEVARERLEKLVAQPRVLPLVNPFTEGSTSTIDESTDKAEVVPAWAAPSSEPETNPEQPPDVETAPAEPPTSVTPAGGLSLPGKPQNKRWMVNILVGVITIVVIAFIARYITLQSQAKVQAQNLQKTLAIAETLTSFPRPTLIPTWTASPTRTALPTTTDTFTPTITPTLQYTLTRTPHPASLIGPGVGLYAPDLSLTDVATGKQVTLSQFDSQPVLLFFWATWCSQCINDISTIETVYKTYKDTGLVVLGINDENSATVTRFRSTYQMTFPILLDPGSVVQALYRVDSIPRYFFISRNGGISFINLGGMTLAEMKNRVETMMRYYPTATP